VRLRLGDTVIPPLRRLRLYVCGVTPYDTTHIGHASTFVWIDTLARTLEHVGIAVEVARNVTDVDDSLLAEARRRGVGWRALATQQTYQFEDDMRKLRVGRPAFEPQSREYVTEVIFLARALIDRGVAYEREGSVYFRGVDVAARAGIDEDEAIRLVGERGGHPDDPNKDHPLDSAVWQRSAEDEPSWSSPWSDGRPGWHAECVAMSTAVLGLALDVHAGGEDLKFPHHAYEAAMAEAATGVIPFARAWMHVGTVRLDGHKVAKSTGNLVFVLDLLQRWPGEAIRLHLLDRPWNEGWDFVEADLEASAARLEELWSAGGDPATNEAAEQEVCRLLVDGLQTSPALDLAIAEGGSAARLARQLLGLI
jgi:cysteinyl-tRNA synthetase